MNKIALVLITLCWSILSYSGGIEFKYEIDGLVEDGETKQAALIVQQAVRQTLENPEYMEIDYSEIPRLGFIYDISKIAFPSETLNFLTIPFPFPEDGVRLEIQGKELLVSLDLTKELFELPDTWFRLVGEKSDLQSIRNRLIAGNITCTVPLKIFESGRSRLDYQRLLDADEEFHIVLRYSGDPIICM